MSETTQASGFFRLAVMSFADSSHLAEPNTLIEKLARLPRVCCHIWLGDTIVGQTEGSLIQDESVGYVNLIANKENYQRRGFGHLAVQYLSHTFRDLGKSRLQLCVSNTNQLALAFYAKTGWQNLGLRPNSSQMFLMEKCL